MLVVVRMKVGGYEDDLLMRFEDVLECKKIGWLKLLRKRKVGRWKGGLSSGRRSEGG
jgi:hypothetical protein